MKYPTYVVAFAAVLGFALAGCQPDAGRSRWGDAKPGFR